MNKQRKSEIKRGHNRYGVDMAYFHRWLERSLNCLENYTSEELARELARMSKASNPLVLFEAEFIGSIQYQAPINSQSESTGPQLKQTSIELENKILQWNKRGMCTKEYYPSIELLCNPMLFDKKRVADDNYNQLMLSNTLHRLGWTKSRRKLSREDTSSFLVFTPPKEIATVNKISTALDAAKANGHPFNSWNSIKELAADLIQCDSELENESAEVLANILNRYFVERSDA